MKLEDRIINISGVGEKTAKKLAKLNIRTIQDLIYYFPRTWQDFSRIQSIKNFRIGQDVIIKADIISIDNFRSAKKRINITHAVLKDDQENQITAVWFSQPFLLNILKLKSTWIFSGKIGFDFNSRKTVLSSPVYVKEPSIFPIYSQTEGLSSKYLRTIIKKILSQIKLDEWLPAQIVEKEGFLDLDLAIRQIHFPTSILDLSKAKKRLAFNELFLLSLKLFSQKRQFSTKRAVCIKINKDILQKFVKSLSFNLTNAQRKASWEIICDLAKNHPMSRLLNGDVGSGKTVVATMAALNSIKSGYRVAWMAPTEILASQHFENVSKLLNPFNIRIGLLTSNQSKVSSIKNIESSIKLNSKFIIHNSDLIIGTHALIQKDVRIEKLGLVIVDEQHRFGIEQRAVLQAKEANEVYPVVNPQDSTIGVNKLIPHFLSMTATPIPRSLALSIYGDLDISVLDELPIGRQKIITKIVDSINRKQAYDFIRKQINSGRQIFVICPLIEEVTQSYQKVTKSYEEITDKIQKQSLFNLDRKSVKKEYDKLSKEIFPEFRVGILHGKMKSHEKEKIMHDFMAGKTKIIVSTSVVEVGIDIPNASVMMIEDAERFGLAQLHQFRGRVGRGQYQSYCLLFTNILSEKSLKRLKVLEKNHDGFQLAESDLELRGPGDFVGNRQSGFLDLKIAKITDIITLNRARIWAKVILEKGLNYFPKLKSLVKINDKTHLE